MSGAGGKTRAGEPVMHAYIYSTNSVTYIPPGLSQNFAQQLSLLYGHRADGLGINSDDQVLVKVGKAGCQAKTRDWTT